jgi:hypothetical protein
LEEVFGVVRGIERPLGILTDAKIIQICEVASPPDIEKSVKVIMDNRGLFFYASCIRQAGNFAAPPMIGDVQTICGVEPLVDAITHYPQIGPRALFAISTMLNDTYKKKMEVLHELGFSGKKVGAICDNVEIKGHYVEKHPWGVSDGSNKPVDEYRF